MKTQFVPFAAGAALTALIATPLSAQAEASAPNAAHEDDGIVISVAYTNELWSAVSGGLDDDAVHLANLDLTAEVDLEKTIGWSGAQFFVYGLYNNDNSFSELAGDAQTVSNIETGVEAFRLYEAWIEQAIGDNASIKVGLYDFNSEFDALETGALFINSGHGIGSDIGLTGENGPSIFPVTSLGARFQYAFADGWTARLAVLDGVPGDPDRPRRTTVKLGDGDGAFIAGEIEAPIPDGRVLIGAWRYTASFDRLDGGTSDANNGAYVRAERTLWREEGAENQGLAAFARAGVNNGDINPFNTFVGAGLVYTGLIEGRDDDQLGLAIATAFASDAFRTVDGAGNAETNIELTYRLQLTDYLTLQPDIQYIINPSADTAIKNALALGLRVEVGFEL